MPNAGFIDECDDDLEVRGVEANGEFDYRDLLFVAATSPDKISLNIPSVNANG